MSWLGIFLVVIGLVAVWKLTALALRLAFAVLIVFGLMLLFGSPFGV
ncbi:hypothetical protein [Arenimonas daejeonensis]|nr:hypothetical protein [Arenimonas daejeonensis]